MSHTVVMVCLAKSSRPGGYCVAGKCVKTGRWIRLIAGFQEQEHALKRCMVTYADGEEMKVLDIIKVPVIGNYQIHHQKENFVISQEGSIEKIGRARFEDLEKMTDPHLEDELF